MKIKTLLVLLCLAGGSVTVLADSTIPMPHGKVSFSIWVPKTSVESLSPGQHVSIEASNGVKGKYDSAPVIQGAVVLNGLILDIGKVVTHDGSVSLVLAITPKEAQTLKDTQAQKADLSIEVLPSK